MRWGAGYCEKDNLLAGRLKRLADMDRTGGERRERCEGENWVASELGKGPWGRTAKTRFVVVNVRLPMCPPIVHLMYL
jgi:hypothetical protein